MRKLYYVGTNETANLTTETTSFNKMKELKKEGFTFKTVLKEEKEKISEEEKEYRKRRIKKIKNNK